MNSNFIILLFFLLFFSVVGICCSFLIISTYTTKNNIPVLFLIFFMNCFLLYIQYYLIYFLNNNNNNNNSIDYFGQSSGITNVEHTQQQSKKKYINDALGFVNKNASTTLNTKKNNNMKTYQHNQNKHVQSMNTFKT